MLSFTAVTSPECPGCASTVTLLNKYLLKIKTIPSTLSVMNKQCFSQLRTKAQNKLLDTEHLHYIFGRHFEKSRHFEKWPSFHNVTIHKRHMFGRQNKHEFRKYKT